jgi:hypothetical protein
MTLIDEEHRGRTRIGQNKTEGTYMARTLILTKSSSHCSFH